MQPEIVQQLRNLANQHPNPTRTLLNQAADTLQHAQQQATDAHNILAAPNMIWLITQPDENAATHAEQLKPHLANYWTTYGPQFIDFTNLSPTPAPIDIKHTTHTTPTDPDILELTTGETNTTQYRQPHHNWQPIHHHLKQHLTPYNPDTITQKLNISHHTLHHWQKHGLTHTEAQQTAQQLNLNPTTLWPNWPQQT